MRRTWVVLPLCLGFGVVGSASVSGQLIQGSDYDTSYELGNPDNWTSVKVADSTISFKLNSCEYVLYFDSLGRPRSCMGQPVDCTTLGVMETTLQNALAMWDGLATDALTIDYDGIVGDGTCVVPPETCPATDIWADDAEWVVTRSYHVEGNPVDCDDAATPAMGEDGGAGLRFFDDPVENHDTRTISECDIVFFEDKWDNAEGNSCRDAGLYTQQQCADAWLMALVHEVGHCLGFGHSYLTRKTLDPLEQAEFFDGFGLDLDNGAPSIMSYDRVGSVLVGIAGELNPYDEAVYLYNYAVDPDQGTDDHFTASGTVTECSGDEIFGAGVLALEKVDADTLKPVQMSITGLDPLLSDGDFELNHLDRNKDYRVLVVDVRNENQIYANGWQFNMSQGPIPGLTAYRTDDWSETNSGGAYRFEMKPIFMTGFDPTLTDLYESPAEGNDLPIDDEDVCVEFD